MNLKDPKVTKTLADFARLVLGVLVALAWKEPINYFANQFLPPGAAFFTLTLFALVVTIFAVFVMLFVFNFIQPGSDLGSSPDLDDVPTHKTDSVDPDPTGASDSATSSEL